MVEPSSVDAGKIITIDRSQIHVLNLGPERLPCWNDIHTWTSGDSR